jgi:hypothetical protein
MQQQSSGTTSSGGTSFRQTGTSSVPASPNRIGTNEQSTTTTTTTAAAATTTNLNPSIGENGSLFTLTNIYTFGGGDGTSTHGPSDLSSDKYRVKSFVEVFDQPSSQQDTEYERHYRETQSSSSFTRKVRTSATDTYDYGDNGHHDSSRYQHHYETTGPSSTKYIHGRFYLSIAFVLNTVFLNLHGIFQVNDLFVYMTFVYFFKGTYPYIIFVFFIQIRTEREILFEMKNVYSIFLFFFY